MTDTTALLDVDAVAEVLQVKPATVRAYHKRKQMPKADLYFGRSPVWQRQTIDAWMSNRRPAPQRGEESDPGHMTIVK